MDLVLKRIHKDHVEGIYGSTKDQMPRQWRLLHPAAADSLRRIFFVTGKIIRVSGLWRSAEASLAARQSKSGVQPPAYSAHNFGLAMDIDVENCLVRFDCDKPSLDELLQMFGWYCHRKDGKQLFEAWHYNFLGDEDEAAAFLAHSAASSNTSSAVQANLQQLYGSQMSLPKKKIQAALQKLGFYHGEIDGLFGPLTNNAIEAFCRAWLLGEQTYRSSKFQRTLAFVAADKRIQEVG